MNETIGKRIERLMNENKVTKTELAKVIGVHRTSIYNYINEPRLLSLDALLKLTELFGVGLEELVGLNSRNKVYPSLEQAIDGVKEAEVEYISKTDQRLYKMETEIKDLKKDLEVMKRKIKAMS